MPISPRVYPLGKPGLGFTLFFGKSGEYWVIKYFKEVSRGPVPDTETQGLGVRQCRIPRHFPMNGSGSGSTFICPVSCL